MDVAFNQHSSHARRQNRSTGALNRLSLAPLTTKLPLADREEDYFADTTAAAATATAASPHHSVSYLQGKSAPTTPRLLSRSPTRRTRSARRSSTPSAMLPKSKSAIHISSSSRADAASSTRRRRRDDHNNSHITAADRSDADWFFRAGALISTETRESKGQSWLVSRESSTSLAGMRDDDDDDRGDHPAPEHHLAPGAQDREDAALDRELARARELAGKYASGNFALSSPPPPSSLPVSRLGSRSHSRVGSRSQLVTPSERKSMDGYFSPRDDYVSAAAATAAAGPDFINLDERLEGIEEVSGGEDEAHVRRLVKGGRAGGWFDSVFGWSLFSVDEHEEESSDTEGEDTEEAEGEDEVVPEERWRSRSRQFEGVTTAVEEERMPPPKADQGGWQDAAWLLSVASKVLL